MEKIPNNCIAIIGQGYVGLPLAMSAVKAGWKVYGVEKSLKKIQDIKNFRSPIEDVSNFTIVEAIKSGNYLITSSYEVVTQAKIVIFCVPTPLDHNHAPDLSLLEEAIFSVAQFITDDTLIVSESTSYPGTLRNFIAPIIEKKKNTKKINVMFAVAPERINPGDATWNMQNTPRVIGAMNETSLNRAVNFYKTFCDEVVPVKSPEIAECAKLLENTFRLVNIGLINELTQVFSSLDIDINSVISAAATKPYGFMPFRPGVGVGGHCIPIDPLYLAWWANSKNFKLPIVELASETNQAMHRFIALKALKLPVVKKPKYKILLLGIAYKAGISDTRETPMRNLRSFFEELGHEVGWIDPLIDEWEGSPPASLIANFDVAIIGANQVNLPVDELVRANVPILDCSNSFTNQQGIECL